MPALPVTDTVVHPAFLARADRGTRTLRVFGELDSYSAAELLREAGDGLRPWMNIAVCLESLTFIDAAGLGALVTLREQHRLAGGSVIVINAAPPIAGVFALGGLEDLLHDRAVLPPLGIRTRPRHRLDESASVRITVARQLRSA
jgi:anti-anti-sigma factor